MKETASLSHDPELVWGSSTTSQCVPDGSHTMFDSGISEKFTQLDISIAQRRKGGVRQRGKVGEGYGMGGTRD
jgi:hypothetical protein